VDFRPHVDLLFSKLPRRYGSLCENPVIGGCFVRGVDPIGPQKKAACRALVARAREAWTNPGMPPLPLSSAECYDLKSRQGIDYLWSEYASSLRILKYDDFRHPSFEQYARGVMASPLAPDFITKDPQLLKRFPPRPLPGLGSGLCWKPPKRDRRLKSTGRPGVTLKATA
jgi:hypothetical protein